MNFLNRPLRNLGFLKGIGPTQLIFFPNILLDVFKIYGAAFGPIALIFLVGAVLPNKKRTR